MKKFIKFIQILVITSTLCFCMFCGNSVEAVGGGVTNATVGGGTGSSYLSGSETIDKIFSAGSDWISTGQNEAPSGTSEDDFISMFIGLGQLLVGIGVITVLVVTAITAIKWITATPDKQAKLKQQLIGLIVSIIVIFGAVGIWNVVKGIMKEVETELVANKDFNPEIIIVSDK